jgi:signal transduction histidine kinase
MLFLRWNLDTKGIARVNTHCESTQETSLAQLRNLTQLEERFRGRFAYFMQFWVIITLITLSVNLYLVLSAQPAYWHDWRASASIGISLLLLILYAQHLLFYRRHLSAGGWPPHLVYSLGLWFLIYFLILGLRRINPAFAWDYWALFGISFSLFSLRLLMPLLLLCIGTMLFATGLLQWPPTSIDIGSLASISLALTSSLISALTIYLLLSDRFERAALLQQLSEAHLELEEAHRHLEASLAQEQELAILRERTRLAREMHDTLGHALTLIAVKLEASRRLLAGNPERCERELSETLDIARQTMQELRASIENLRSPTLERESLAIVLTRLAQGVAERCGLRLTLEIAPNLEDLSAELQETLWRIAQEALTNVEKHAHASQLVLQVQRPPGRVIMRIEDDGVGLPAGLCRPDEHGHDDICESPPGHYGLSGMRERAQQSGGTLQLSTRPAGGLGLEVSLPLVESPRGPAT